MPKEKTYKVIYSFSGSGECQVKAINEEQARNNFYDGDCNQDTESGQDYEIDSVELIEE